MNNEAASPQSPIVDASRIDEIARNVFVIPDNRIPLVPNVGIVAGDHSVLVVDAGLGLANGEAVFDAAKRIAGDRRIILTVTHFHPEHGFGAQAFKGKAKILYNRMQKDDLDSKGAAYMDMFLGFGDAVKATLKDTEIVAPDQTYEGPRHTLDLGGITVELLTFGLAHTGGDQVVWLPEQEVLFTGDLAESNIFPIFPWFPPKDADVDARNWADVLKTLADMGPKIVVPGHGDVGDVEIIKGVRDYMVDLEARVRSRQNEGKDIDAIISELRPQLLGEHPTWTGTEWIDYAVRYYVSTQA